MHPTNTWTVCANSLKGYLSIQSEVIVSFLASLNSSHTQETYYLRIITTTQTEASNFEQIPRVSFSFCQPSLQPQTWNFCRYCICSSLSISWRLKLGLQLRRSLDSSSSIYLLNVSNKTDVLYVKRFIFSDDYQEKIKL